MREVGRLPSQCQHVPALRRPRGDVFCPAFIAASPALDGLSGAAQHLVQVNSTADGPSTYGAVQAAPQPESSPYMRDRFRGAMPLCL